MVRTRPESYRAPVRNLPGWVRSGGHRWACPRFWSSTASWSHHSSHLRMRSRLRPRGARPVSSWRTPAGRPSKYRASRPRRGDEELAIPEAELATLLHEALRADVGEGDESTIHA